MDSQHSNQTSMFAITSIFIRSSMILYFLIGLILIGMAIFGTWIAAHDAVRAMLSKADPVPMLLTAVGLMVLALAVFDVGKYLIDEEVLRTRCLREIREVRHTLTKFLTILIIALGLEALVYVFQVGSPEYLHRGTNTGLPHLIYPTMLIVATAILLIALGWYQKISLHAEIAEKQELAIPPSAVTCRFAEGEEDCTNE